MKFSDVLFQVKVTTETFATRFTSEGLRVLDKNTTGDFVQKEISGGIYVVFTYFRSKILNTALDI